MDGTHSYNLRTPGDIFFAFATDVRQFCRLLLFFNWNNSLQHRHPAVSVFKLRTLRPDSCHNSSWNMRNTHRENILINSSTTRKALPRTSLILKSAGLFQYLRYLRPFAEQHPTEQNWCMTISLPHQAGEIRTRRCTLHQNVNTRRHSSPSIW